MTQANYLLLHNSKLFDIIHSEPHIKGNLKNDCFFGNEAMTALKLLFLNLLSEMVDLNKTKLKGKKDSGMPEVTSSNGF